MSALDLQLISDYTGGFNMPTATQANGQFVGVAVTLPDGSVNIDWKPVEDVLAINPTLIDPLVPLLAGGRHIREDDQTPSKLEVFADAQYMDLTDDFNFFNAPSGYLIGETSWVRGASAGTPSLAVENALGGLSGKIVGAVRITTGATTNNDFYMCKGISATSAVFDVDRIERFAMNGVLPSLVQCELRFGVGTDISDPFLGTESLRIEYDASASANWRVVYRTSGSDTTVFDTGIAVVANEPFAIGAKTPFPAALGTFDFYINGVKVDTRSLANTGVNVGMYLRTETNAAKSVIVDRMHIRSSILTGRKVFA